MAKEKKKNKKEKEIFFVGVKEPVEIRRNILEASREMILLLQMYEKFKLVREEKRREMEKLRGLVREIAVLASRIKRHLPKTDLRALPIEEIKKKDVLPKKQKESVTNEDMKREEKTLTREITEIEKLEAELASIEKKLNNLT